VPDALAGLTRDPLAAELSALLRDTAGLAADLLTARAATAVRTAAPALPAVTAPRVLRIDLADMPYLRDHCFFRQRPGWPDDADRWPVVPAT
ncbi:hypothetical protein K7G98_39715, partial [Saccharothrix sp. MB29]|nr:hypothetical protein [Saccharothrix sp. MB29]